MTTAIIVGFICLGLVLLCLGLYFIHKYFYGASKVYKILTSVTYTFGISAIVLGAIIIPNHISKKERAAIESKMNSGYDVYVNGTKVEPEHITLGDYSLDTITVHDDTNEIHIAANK